MKVGVNVLVTPQEVGTLGGPLRIVLSEKSMDGMFNTAARRTPTPAKMSK